MCHMYGSVQHTDTGRRMRTHKVFLLKPRKNLSPEELKIQLQEMRLLHQRRCFLGQFCDVLCIGVH